MHMQPVNVTPGSDVELLVELNKDERVDGDGNIGKAWLVYHLR